MIIKSYKQKKQITKQKKKRQYKNKKVQMNE